MRVIQFPIWEMPWPRKKSRKLRTRNEANVSRVAAARRSGITSDLTGRSPVA